MRVAGRTPIPTEPLIVKPREACRLLGCSNTRLYELIGARELDSFLDGRSRKITVESIHQYIFRRITRVTTPPRGRSRPHDAQESIRHEP
jgi:excisionase family DNA binding protein